MTDRRDEYVTVTFRLRREDEAWLLMRALRTAAFRETRLDISAKWRQMAHYIEAEGNIPVGNHRRVVRPDDDDEVALRRVIKGEEPYPVLSSMDARRAFLALDGDLSARLIAHRIHMDRATITRWRRQYRNGEWSTRYGL